MRKRDEIESHLNNFLLKPVMFKINDKVIKKGKLKIFSIKQFFIKFNLEINDDIKVFEVPYPFKMHVDTSCITFEYTLSSLCNSNNSSLYYKIKTANKQDSSKMFDGFLNMIVT